MTARNLLRQLVMISSENPGSDCRAIANFIADFLRQQTQARLTLQPVNGGNINLIVRFGRPRFFINAHLDTVPRANDQKSVLKLKIHRHKLYGLGTVDVKGGIACQLTALTQSKPKNILFIYSCNEETGANTGIKTFLASRHARNLETGIVTEPTGLRIVNQHSGIADFEIIFNGRAAHAAYPEQGINAIEKAAIGITRLIAYRKHLHHQPPRGLRTTLNPGVIKGGIKSNIVPEQCTLKLNLRYPSDQSLKKLRGDLQRLTAGLSASLRMTYQAPPLVPNPVSIPIVQRLYQAGARLNANGVNFWSEAALFAQAGIPAVVFGPGGIEQAHTADEFIHNHELDRGTAIYRQFFATL